MRIVWVSEWTVIAGSTVTPRPVATLCTKVGNLSDRLDAVERLVARGASLGPAQLRSAMAQARAMGAVRGVAYLDAVA